MCIGLALAAVLAGGCSDDDDVGRAAGRPFDEQVEAACRASPAPTSTAAALGAADLDATPGRSALGDQLVAMADDATELARRLRRIEAPRFPSDRDARIAIVATDARLLRSAASALTRIGSGGAVAAGLRLNGTVDALADDWGADACAGRFGIVPSRPGPVAPMRGSVECWAGAGVLARLGVVDGSPAPPAPVSCDAGHDVERFLVLTFPAAGTAPYPGQVELAQFADAQCRATFGAETSGRYAPVLPTAAEWSAGEREIPCVRFDPKGRPLATQGAPTTTAR